MKPVERLHIDELKRVEKQTMSLLKAWRRVNKELADLRAEHEKLSDIHAQAQASHEGDIAHLQSEQEKALSGKESAWQTKYDEHHQALVDEYEQKLASEREQYEATIAELKAQIDSLNVAHQEAIDTLTQEENAKREALESELATQKSLKDALIARVRGVVSE